MTQKNRSLVLLLVVSILLAGCDTSAPRSPQTPVLSPAVTRTPAPAQTPRAPSTATPTPVSDVLTLSWWTPEFLSPKATGPSGPLLAKYLAEFEAAHAGKVRVNPILKARYGKGGLLDFLRTTQPVAPTLLPDIVALDTAELEQAISLGLVQPLDGLLTKEITPTLYPFARQEVLFDGRIMAVPLVADLEHLVYDREKVSTPPSTWTGLLADKIPHLFPVGSPQASAPGGLPDDVQHAFISQYLSAGGTLDPKTRRLLLQEQPLQRVLAYYRDAREAGLLPKDILNVSSVDEAWNAFAQGDNALAHVSARRYLAGRDNLPNAGFAPAPGWSNPAMPVGTGWVLAITTPDPARQKAAADLIAWLMAPERAGPWAQAAGWLPSSPKALATWAANPYSEFLDGQLNAAVAHPIGPEYVQTAARLQKAITSVLKGVSTPAEAVQSAINPK